MTSGLGSSSDAGRQARLIPACGVAMNDTLARHLVDERDRLLQSALGSINILTIDCGANALERAAKPRAKLAVALPVLYTLFVRLERGCVRSHLINYLQNFKS